MGVVVVQLGQGGNQMGHALFQCLASMSASAPDEFFRSSAHSAVLTARAVLIDMEPKVISAIMKRAKAEVAAQAQAHQTTWSYDSNRRVTQDSGSGNNWALGFYDHGPKSLDSVLDAIRLEVEQCEYFEGFVTLQSMAGGTGAGLGAYLVEALKDEFPSSFILSHCIWPYESGDVIVQNYNVLLTLSHLQKFADGVIIVQNEQLSAICRSQLGIQRPSFDDMNGLAAQALGSVLLPSHWRTVEPRSQGSPGVASKGKSGTMKANVYGTRKFRLLSDLLSALCAHPGYKMLTMRFTPQVPAQSLDFTNFTWAAQVKHLRQMLITGAHKELEMDWNIKIPVSSFSEHKSNFHSTSSHHLINRSLANLLVLRGSGSESADVSDFADDRMYPIWQVDPLSVTVCPDSYGKYEMATGLLSNCQSSVQPASRALSRAYDMFTAKAYVHQYFEYGMEPASFEGAFASIEDVVERYSAL